jgi:hypothetical protein
LVSLLPPHATKANDSAVAAQAIALVRGDLVICLLH